MQMKKIIIINNKIFQLNNSNSNKHSSNTMTEICNNYLFKIARMLYYHNNSNNNSSSNNNNNYR